MTVRAFRAAPTGPTRALRGRAAQLPPLAVHLLRQPPYDLIARTTHGSPRQLRDFAAMLTRGAESLRFRLPAFATWLLDLAAAAETEILRRQSVRRVRQRGSDRTLRFPLHGLAKFHQPRPAAHRVRP